MLMKKIDLPFPNSRHVDVLVKTEFSFRHKLDKVGEDCDVQFD